MFRQVVIVLSIGAALLAVSRWVEPPPGEWPQRPIELVVFSAPGGGLDVASRVLAAAMADELGAEIRVSNMTGGRGGVAAHYVYGRKHDGYRWLAASEAVLSLATRRAHPSTSGDWHPFVFAGSPGIISVPAESRFRSFAELLQAVRAEPDRFTIAASGRGSIWHLRTELLRQLGEFPVRFIPYDGSGPSQVAALSGEVDLVHTALSEQIALIRGGRLRALAAVEPEPLTLRDRTRIPAITDTIPAVGAQLPLPQWLGFQLPKDTPPKVLARIDQAFHRALRSARVQDFLEKSFNEPYGLSGPQAVAMMRRSEQVLNRMLFELGLVDIAPESVGIGGSPSAEKGGR
jgi:tripartite-type tricarboxylate transporter receptor subunit TctC